MHKGEIDLVQETDRLSLAIAAPSADGVISIAGKSFSSRRLPAPILDGLATPRSDLREQVAALANRIFSPEDDRQGES